MSDRLTLYADADEFEQRVKRFELDHDDIRQNALKRDIHQAIVDVAFEHEEELVEKVIEHAGDNDA